MRQRVRKERQPPVESIPSDRLHLPIRWIIPAIDESGNGAHEGTLSSYGESWQLVKEVTDLCAAFHPTSQMHAFPRENPVVLFWQARSTGDWIVTRITEVPHSEESATRLDYQCLVFDNNTFHALRFNPYRTRSLNLFARLRTHVQGNKTDTFTYTIPMSAVPEGRPVRQDANTRDDFDFTLIAGLEADLLPNEANQHALQEYCSRWQEQPTPPPTFATWWVNSNTEAESYFNVLLRVPEAQAPTLQDTKEATFALTAALRAEIPQPSSGDLISIAMVQAILNNATSAENVVSQLAALVGVMAPQEYQSQVIGIKLHLGQLSTRLNALVKRLQGNLPEGQVDTLHQISDRCDEISHWMQSIRVPGETESAPIRGGKWALNRLGWDKIAWRSPFHLK